MPFRVVAILGAFCAAVAAPVSATVLADLGPPTLGLVLRFEQQPEAGFVPLLRREVEHILRPSGLRVRWEIDNRGSVGVYNRLLVVEMRGRCGAAAANAAPETLRNVPLGHTYVSDGEVIPRSIVYCNEIARVVAHLRTTLPNPSHLPLHYARLAGRVLTHELLHALLGKSEHDEDGLLRSSVHLYDLTTAPRLTPAQVRALRRLDRTAPPSLAQQSAEPAPVRK